MARKRLGNSQKEQQTSREREPVELFDELAEIHSIECRWVKGHWGNPDNERCDLLLLCTHLVGRYFDRKYPGHDFSPTSDGFP